MLKKMAKMVGSYTHKGFTQLLDMVMELLGQEGLLERQILQDCKGWRD
jgi:hypothetical protein